MKRPMQTLAQEIEQLAQQQLEFTQRMTHVSRLVTLGEMAAGMAHEINQPLSAIATYAMACDRLLGASETPVSPDIQEALREINLQAQRAGETIRRLRQLLRPRELRPEPTDLNELIQELWSLVNSDARLHEVQLDFEPEASLPMARVDRIQIQQVLFNLIHNAIEALAGAARPNREVIVRTRQVKPDRVAIDIVDTGPGVDASVAARMFDPFCTTKPEGTGLGLAVSRSIVLAHRGKLEHRANQPTGACFTVTLPIATQERP